jgi:glycosyltransferase involved in cell wall biosynthesis
MISFIVPAYNEEVNIMRCVNSLFTWALSYRGPSEIIVIDDGSIDATFETAWMVINSKQSELGHIRTRVAKHMTNLGRAEALKTGVNKALGEYIALVEATTICDPAWLTKLVDDTYTIEKEAENSIVHPSPKAGATLPNTVRLYRAETLRQLLNEKQVDSVTEL